IADLKVISRTSTQHYQSKPRNLREIAKQLGVANILEGTVQKAADQVRVSVQLINAQTDSHLWAESYDRTFTDIFGVESEIAKRIAESLQARLTGREEQALAVKPTANLEAYDAYLRGLAYYRRTQTTTANSLGAQTHSSESKRIDPNRSLMLHGGVVSGIRASRSSTKPSGSTPAMLTCSPSTRIRMLCFVISPKRCESLIRFSTLYRTTWMPSRSRRLAPKPRATCHG